MRQLTTLMNIAFCYENVLPARGGCATYISSLARRMVADGHEVHLYACTWNEAALPQELHYHRLPPPKGPRFLRPWRFSETCVQAMSGKHQVTVGFDKTYGQDVLYPQGGLHVASAEYNLCKYPSALARGLARLAKGLDLAHWSFCRLERRQYLGPDRPLVIAISEMTRQHFQDYYALDSANLRVIHCATDPGRLSEHDRPRRRLEWRQRWGIGAEETVAFFVAMNYRLKGLEPLLHAVGRLPAEQRRGFRLLVAGNPKTGSYERLARRLGISAHVCFAGFCPDVRNGYFAADFVVHPTFYDPCSHVVLEALACGLPVITSAHNGAGELLDPPREGFVIPDPHDHDHLAWAIAQLLDPARRAACAQAARRTASRWTYEHHYQKMMNVFVEAAARKQAA